MLSQLNIFVNQDKNLSGLYIDDLWVDLGVTPDLEPEDPVTPPEDEEQTVDMTVTVTWNHMGNPNPPESVKVTLYEDGVWSQTVEVTAADGWTYTFSELPKYDSQNRKINYSVAVEDGFVPEGYFSGGTGTSIVMVYADLKPKFEIAEEEEAIPD